MTSIAPAATPYQAQADLRAASALFSDALAANEGSRAYGAALTSASNAITSAIPQYTELFGARDSLRNQLVAAAELANSAGMRVIGITGVGEPTTRQAIEGWKVLADTAATKLFVHIVELPNAQPLDPPNPNYGPGVGATDPRNNPPAKNVPVPDGNTDTRPR